MLQKVVQFRPSAVHTGKLLTRAELDAYDPESESWQAQFARRYTHHCDLDGILRNVENVNASPIVSKP